MFKKKNINWNLYCSNKNTLSIIKLYIVTNIKISMFKVDWVYWQCSMISFYSIGQCLIFTFIISHKRKPFYWFYHILIMLDYCKLLINFAIIIAFSPYWNRCLNILFSNHKLSALFFYFLMMTFLHIFLSGYL